MKSDPKITESLFQEEVLDVLSEGTPISSKVDLIESLEVKGKAKIVLSSEVQKLVVLLEQATDLEGKIKLCIEFMRGKLSGSNSPSFREFWEVRRICLPLFKENLSSKARGDLWRQYVDLSVEARRLKGILDEQSAFACEQIDLAIQSLIGDLDSYETLLSQMPDLNVNLELPPIALKKSEYNEMQKQLHLLNALAAKVNSLRKEAIKTDMRVRSKNKIFENLSTCGDRIFPRRKELIKKISQDFTADINSFVKIHFEDDQKMLGSMHLLREEVKNLQTLAKQLTLNTQSFKDTRIALSFCWDQLRKLDKEKKKEVSEQRVQQRQSYEDAMLKVREFEQFCADQISLPIILAKYEEVLQSLKGIDDLRIHETKQIKEMLLACKRPFEEKQRMIRLEQENQAKDLENSRLKKVQDLRDEIQCLLETADQMALEDLVVQKASLQDRVKILDASKVEKMALERLMRQLKDRLLEVRGKRLLSLSCSDQEKYNELKSVLLEKKDRRLEVKDQLEGYRKALGNSGFDFEKAMLYRDLIESEKDVLEKMNSAIDELEKKMVQIEG